VKGATIMLFVVGVRCDKEPLTHGGEELARILRDLADRVEDGGNYFRLKEVNGEYVGAAEFRLSGRLTDVGIPEDGPAW
jgi:hypothetical protein